MSGPIGQDSPGGLSAVLFDLDGTLLDTAPDMVATLNQILVEESRTELPYEHARRYVSNGIPGLLKLAFGELGEEEHNRLRQRFRQIYGGRLALATSLFAGMEQVLCEFEERAILWGVVTNKPAQLTEPLLEELQLLSRCACVVSGDTLPWRKPDPQPLLHALEQIGVAPAASVYVGDAARDIIAGRAAGMRTVAALYGYIPTDEDPAAWGADLEVREPVDLLGVLELRTREEASG